MLYCCPLSFASVLLENSKQQEGRMDNKIMILIDLFVVMNILPLMISDTINCNKCDNNFNTNRTLSLSREILPCPRQRCLNVI